MKALAAVFFLIASFVFSSAEAEIPNCFDTPDPDTEQARQVREYFRPLGQRAMGEIGKILDPVLDTNAPQVLARVVTRGFVPEWIAQCTTYATRLRAGLLEAPACSAAATKMIDLMEIRARHYRGMSAFESEFVGLLLNKDVEPYLSDLLAAAEAKRIKNLWTWTLEHRAIDGDKKKAIKWLGLLFRDLPVRMYDYKCGAGPLTLKAMVATLRNLDGAQLLPPPLTIHNHGVHHFYTIAYLTQRLTETGVDPLHALALTYGMNESYEKASKMGLSPVNEKDVFLGFAGAAFVFTREKQKFNGYSQQKFHEEYHKDPQGAFMRALVDTLIPNET